MRNLIVTLFLFGLGSTWAVSFSLGHCVSLYTGSIIYGLLFTCGSSFISALLLSNYLVEKYVRPCEAFF